jgi:hypothetical protein
MHNGRYPAQKMGSWAIVASSQGGGLAGDGGGDGCRELAGVCRSVATEGEAGGAQQLGSVDDDVDGVAGCGLEGAVQRRIAQSVECLLPGSVQVGVGVVAGGVGGACGEQFGRCPEQAPITQRGGDRDRRVLRRTRRRRRSGMAVSVRGSVVLGCFAGPGALRWVCLDRPRRSICTCEAYLPVEHSIEAHRHNLTGGA